MKNRFLISVAALALIAGTGFANAQGGHEHESGSSQMQSAPSSAGGGATGGAATEHEGSKSGMKSEKSSSGQRAEENSPSQKKSMSSENESKSGAKEMNKSAETKQPGAATEKNAQTKGTEMEKNAQTKGTTTEKSAQTKGTETEKSAQTKGTETEKNAQTKGTEAEKNAQTKGTETNQNAQNRDNNRMNAQGKSETSTTVGQAGAGAKLSTEQRTKITSVIRSEHVQSVDHVNFSISVGTRVPREGVSFRPLPTEVVSIYPEWRGYDFILVHEQIVVIDPNTYEIVAVIDA